MKSLTGSDGSAAVFISGATPVRAGLTEEKDNRERGNDKESAHEGGASGSGHAVTTQIEEPATQDGAYIRGLPH